MLAAARGSQSLAQRGPRCRVQGFTDFPHDVRASLHRDHLVFVAGGGLVVLNRTTLGRRTSRGWEPELRAAASTSQRHPPRLRVGPECALRDLEAVMMCRRYHTTGFHPRPLYERGPSRVVIGGPLLSVARHHRTPSWGHDLRDALPTC